jgi:GNAT superfamily N-acetyltransferase
MSGCGRSIDERFMIIEDHQGDRGELQRLFALADDSAAQISTYIGRGKVLVAREAGDIIGHLQILETEDVGVFELKSMAVSEGRQGEGVGSRLVEAAVVWCREHEASRLVVSTAAGATGALRFYQRRGFRMLRVVRDAFGPSNGYAAGALVDGIPLRDQVFLDLEVECGSLSGACEAALGAPAK